MAEEDSYFAANPVPSTISPLLARASDFVTTHTSSSPPRRIAFVTSGGTTVPLERRTVRFLDNFSAGTRGAASAEQFLAAGYAVIFLHRKGSLTPFARHFPRDGLFELLGEALDKNELDQELGGDTITIPTSRIAALRPVLRQYATSRQAGTLLKLPYITVTEYLWALRGIATLLAPAGPHALCYLAAAVSDFYIPDSQMVEHKIQSAGETASDNAQTTPPAAQVQGDRLIVTMEPVPKLLGILRHSWAPQAMVISFKLETDADMLLKKAHRALQRDGHELVIGNLLETRAHEVVFVAKDAESWVRKPQEQTEQEIEAQMIPHVAALHDDFIRKGCRR